MSTLAQTVDRYWKIGVALLAIGVAWGTLTAGLAQKADRSSIDALVAEVRAVRAEVQQIRRFLCQERPQDMGCQR